LCTFTATTDAQLNQHRTVRRLELHCGRVALDGGRRRAAATMRRASSVVYWRAPV
jgi:hypothetical protein